MTGYISYCPELDLFHYFVEGSVDQKFSLSQGEDLIAAHLGENREKEADFVASLIALAKSQPHVKISLTDDTNDEKAT